MDSFFEKIYSHVKAKNPGEPEFLQAVEEVLHSLAPLHKKNPKLFSGGLLETLIEPERIIQFRVPWMNDRGEVEVNRGFRVQYNSALGPYKGGLRFHPSVNLGVMKFLAFEQTFKNALTGLPMGGGKGGSDFDPKGKSEGEVMRFCQSFMLELWRHIGENTDVPAGDIGVGAREIGYMYGAYRKISNDWTGVLTGKAPAWGGSLGRKEATGYGLLYFMAEALKAKGHGLDGKDVVISGSGNVAIYAAEKAMAMGARVLAMSDSDGFIYDREGVDLALVKMIKEEGRGRIKEYIVHRRGASYEEGAQKIWTIPCELALPSATQNELGLEGAKALIKNGCRAVGEGANMPTTPEAVAAFQAAGLIFAPAKASNAGGVSTSGLEMSQNSLRMAWSFEEVDQKLRRIMQSIYEESSETAKEYGRPEDLVMGANMAGFIRVAKAMKAFGVI